MLSSVPLVLYFDAKKLKIDNSVAKIGNEDSMFLLHSTKFIQSSEAAMYPDEVSVPINVNNVAPNLLPTIIDYLTTHLLLDMANHKKLNTLLFHHEKNINSTTISQLKELYRQHCDSHPNILKTAFDDVCRVQGEPVVLNDFKFVIREYMAFVHHQMIIYRKRVEMTKRAIFHFEKIINCLLNKLKTDRERTFMFVNMMIEYGLLYKSISQPVKLSNIDLCEKLSAEVNVNYRKFVMKSIMVIIQKAG